MYRLVAADANRVEQLIERIKAEIEKQGMKPVRQSVMLRALIFYGQKIKTEDLIEAVKQAQVYA